MWVTYIPWQAQPPVLQWVKSKALGFSETKPGLAGSRWLLPAQQPLSLDTKIIFIIQNHKSDINDAASQPGRIKSKNQNQWMFRTLTDLWLLYFTNLQTELPLIKHVSLRTSKVKSLYTLVPSCHQTWKQLNFGYRLGPDLNCSTRTLSIIIRNQCCFGRGFTLSIATRSIFLDILYIESIIQSEIVALDLSALSSLYLHRVKYMTKKNKLKKVSLINR